MQSLLRQNVWNTAGLTLSTTFRIRLADYVVEFEEMLSILHVVENHKRAFDMYSKQIWEGITVEVASLPDHDWIRSGTNGICHIDMPYQGSQDRSVPAS